MAAQWWLSWQHQSTAAAHPNTYAWSVIIIYYKSIILELLSCRHSLVVLATTHGRQGCSSHLGPTFADNQPICASSDTTTPFTPVLHCMGPMLQAYVIPVSAGSCFRSVRVMCRALGTRECHLKFRYTCMHELHSSTGQLEASATFRIVHT